MFLCKYGYENETELQVKTYQELFTCSKFMGIHACSHTNTNFLHTFNYAFVFFILFIFFFSEVSTLVELAADYKLLGCEFWPYSLAGACYSRSTVSGGDSCR